MRQRLMALVGAGERRATHTAGYPLDPAKMLPATDVVLLEPGEDDRSAMLYRYTAHGELAGDTWHASRADAERSAAEEFGDALGPWVPLPEDVSDPHGFAVRYAHERLDSRGDW